MNVNVYKKVGEINVGADEKFIKYVRISCSTNNSYRNDKANGKKLAFIFGFWAIIKREEKLSVISKIY